MSVGWLRGLGCAAACVLGALFPCVRWVVAAETAKAAFPHAAVAADHPAASAAGVEILQQGGNVVDAAIATGFALSVVRPASSGLGGGGFLVYWNAATQEGVAVDYRERAPLAATADMYSKANAQNPAAAESSRRGMLAVAVPGHIPGLCAILQKHGTLPLATVLQPALRLARDGVPVDEHDLSVQRGVLRDFERHPEYRERYAVLWERYLNQGKPWKPGDRFFSPQLPALELLARQGWTAETRRTLAEAIVAESQRSGGVLTRPDFDIEPTWRRPLEGNYRGHRLLTMPPPSSGGVALLETLGILSAWSASPRGRPLSEMASAERVHLVTEAFKHAFADRAEYLGDADFVAVPVKRLISPAHAARLAAKIDLERTLPPAEYGRFAAADDQGTTHFSVMDAAGNAVACTETINTTFGSYVVEPRFGIVLNNEMDDFAAVPGAPNAFGLIQSAANSVAPRKKPLSSMTPTIAVQDGRAVVAVGASGGPRIITATFQALTNVLDFGRDAQAAVQLPRFHHQWSPNELLLEPELHRTLGAALSGRGHSLKSTGELAATQLIRRTAAGLEPASDPRKHGRPAGY